MSAISKVLILTVAYGQGHISAAAGIAEEYISRGSKVMVADPCDADSTGFYTLSKAYYRLCVRRAPWLWAMAYAQTDTADWSSKVTWPIIRTATNRLADLLISWRPDVVVCTYPLYAYMMDHLSELRISDVPYAVVVTDSLEISRPWVKSRTNFLFVPDGYSASMLRERYGLPDSVVIESGFPVRKAFQQFVDKDEPSMSQLNILYGAYLSTEATVRQIRSLFEAFPQAEIVLLAGDRYAKLFKRLYPHVMNGSLTLLSTSEQMPALFSKAHLYIGKTGAATMFEAYASCVPVIANYALPGQEQGNLRLILRDGVGCWAGSPGSLISSIQELLQNNAAKWKVFRSNMRSLSHRTRGAACIANVLEERLS